MLKPSANIITVPHKSTYSLVIAVAKRARQIAQKAEEEGTILMDKPVDMAVQDFVEGKYLIIEPDEESEEAASAVVISLIFSCPFFVSLIMT